MAYLDVFPNFGPAARTLPYLVEIQADLLSDLPTVVVVPLSLPKVVDNVPVLRLNPAVTINGKQFLVMTQLLAAIDRRHLKQQVACLSEHRAEIVAALDFLFSGF